MKRKGILLLLVVCIMLGLAACGKESGTDTANTFTVEPDRNNTDTFEEEPDRNNTDIFEEEPDRNNTDIFEEEPGTFSDGTAFVAPEGYSAIMELTINPQFRLYISNEMRIMAVECMNEDAIEVAGKLDIEGEMLEDAVNHVVEEANRQGFVEENAKISLAVVVIPDESARKNTIMALNRANDTVKIAAGEQNMAVEVIPSIAENVLGEEEKCPDCDGVGSFVCPECNGVGDTLCSTCGGKGEASCLECDQQGYITCDLCGGTGHDSIENCPSCHGSGKCDNCGGRGSVTIKAGGGPLAGTVIGTETCSVCHGSKTCVNCNGVGRPCNRCASNEQDNPFGIGKIACRTCDGGGVVPCQDCHGNGHRVCSCGNMGRVQCGTCDGTGIVK